MVARQHEFGAGAQGRNPAGRLQGLRGLVNHHEIKLLFIQEFVVGGAHAGGQHHLCVVQQVMDGLFLALADFLPQGLDLAVGQASLAVIRFTAAFLLAIVGRRRQYS